MDETSIRGVLDSIEEQLRGGEEAPMRDFWKVVSAAKRDPELAELYGPQIAAIDRIAFAQWRPLIRVGIVPGTVLALLGTAAGLALVGVGYYVTAPWNGLAILAGTGVLLGTTHGLAHLLVGALVGIRFISWFVASMTQPQPGLKTDYDSYLRAPPRSRAWMHASGAIATKAVPFIMLGPTLAAGAPAWTWIVLLVIGVGQIITDLIWSTKSSDWMRFGREMAVAKELEAS